MVAWRFKYKGFCKPIVVETFAGENFRELVENKIIAKKNFRELLAGATI